MLERNIYMCVTVFTSCVPPLAAKWRRQELAQTMGLQAEQALSDAQGI